MAWTRHKKKNNYFLYFFFFHLFFRVFQKNGFKTFNGQEKILKIGPIMAKSKFINQFKSVTNS